MRAGFARLLCDGTSLATFVTLSTNREIRILPRGEWVRVKNGLHAGDLGQVVDHDSQTNVVTVRLIPRVDFNEAIERVSLHLKKVWIVH